MAETLLPNAGYGESRIILGDVLEKLDDFEDGKFRLLISSPPYNIGKEYEHRSSLESYLKWQEEIIASLLPKLAENGSIVWQTGNYVDKGEIIPLDICFYQIFKKFGLKMRNRIIWHFEHGLHCSRRFSGRYETAIWFTKSNEYVFNLDSVRVPSKYPGKLHYKGPKKGLPSGNPLGKNPSDFWVLNHIGDEFAEGIINIPNVKNNHPEKTAHPCQFPVELIERFVLACTNEGDCVFDPFGGVGSSLIAAVKHKRNGIMCEINADYVEIARKRLGALMAGELKTRPIGKPIHRPSGREKISQPPKEWTQKSLI